MGNLAGVILQSGVLGLDTGVTETGCQVSGGTTAHSGPWPAKIKGPEDNTAWYGQEKKLWVNTAVCLRLSLCLPVSLTQSPTTTPFKK